MHDIHVCTCSCVCQHAYENYRGQLLVPSSIAVCLIFWDKVSQRIWSTLIWLLSCPIAGQLVTTLFPSLGFHAYSTAPDFAWVLGTELTSSCLYSKHLQYEPSSWPFCWLWKQAFPAPEQMYGEENKIEILFLTWRQRQTPIPHRPNHLSMYRYLLSFTCK